MHFFWRNEISGTSKFLFGKLALVATVRRNFVRRLRIVVFVGKATEATAVHKAAAGASNAMGVWGVGNLPLVGVLEAVGRVLPPWLAWVLEGSWERWKGVGRGHCPALSR